MTTNYPASLDTTTELPSAAGVGANLSTFPHSTLHGNAHDAIRAIEAELGVAPSDTFSTVKARLDTITPLGIWTTYTPTLVQGVTITKTVGYGRYMRVGRTIIGGFHMTATSAGTAGAVIDIGLPVACSLPDGMIVGTGGVFRASNFMGPLGTRSTTSVAIYMVDGLLGADLTGSTFDVTLASTNVVMGTFMYEGNL